MDREIKVRDWPAVVFFVGMMLVSIATAVGTLANADAIPNYLVFLIAATCGTGFWQSYEHLLDLLN